MTVSYEKAILAITYESYNSKHIQFSNQTTIKTRKLDIYGLELQSLECIQSLSNQTTIETIELDISLARDKGRIKTLGNENVTPSFKTSWLLVQALCQLSHVP